MKLAIIIPFYMGDDFIDRCLDSLQSFPEDQIYLVDNSPKRFKSDRQINTIVSSQVKIGFGSAVNLAFEQIDKDTYDYILILNQDAYFQNGHLAKLLDYLEQNPCDRFLSPMIYCEDFSTIMPFLSQRYFQTEEYREKKEKGIIEIDIHDFVAVALLVPTQLMEKLGGFDPQFFMYYEDTDLIARANLEKPVKILLNIHVGHHNPDLKKGVKNKEKDKWIEKSRLLYLKKHKSGVIWSIAVLKSRLRKLKNAIFVRDLGNHSHHQNKQA